MLKSAAPPLGPELSKVPMEYHDLQAAFSKDKAHALPPHREYDCAVNLLPGTTPPRGRLFSLSTPEKVAMEEYIREALTIKDRYPLPLMKTVFEALQQAAIFTKLDLRSAYNLIRIQQGDECKTAFITPSGH
ncbi:hypothetical protein NFI96_004462 [Prochilodus magdalenae]|nr:hypothetical protein NFI96_004462 [Prochilodus magdalenae]